MNIVLNNSSQIPLYQQIYEQIVSQILNNTLPTDFCLPSIRNIAKELEISVITVKNAYELLEQNSFIYTIAGKGSFVSNLDNLKISKEQLIKNKAIEIVDFCKKYQIPINLLIKEIKNLK